MKYIWHDSIDPYFNLALEEWVLENLKDDIYVYLWRNDNSIIIGRNQNTAEEINQQYVEENNITIARRATGGGAVYHDLGNLNFSIFADAEDRLDINFELLTQPVLRAFEAIGVPAELKGRNDILIEGKKCSGLSQRIAKDRVLHNGAMLFDSNLDTLSKALNVRRDKLESKGVKSAVKRVTNIKPYMKDQSMTTLDFRDLLKKEMFYEYDYDKIPQYQFTDEQLTEINNLKKNKFAKWEWNYGKSPKTNFKADKRFEGAGVLDIRLNIDEGHINEAKIYGDFFGKKDKSELEKALIGAKFTPESIREALKDYKVSDYLGKMGIDELLEVLFESQNPEETML